MPRRLRILFVIGNMGGGGAERQVVEILKHLDRARFEPILYAGSRSGELLDEVPPDVPIHSFWEDFLRSWRSRWHRVFRTVSHVRWRHLARLLADERIDLVYDRTFHATVDAAVACWWRPTPRVSCCVCDPESDLKLYARRMPLFARRFSRWAFSSASIVLANSEGLRRRLVEFHSLPESHVRTHYNLVDFERLDNLSAEFVPDVPRDPFLIVTGGRLDPLKGQRFLLDAVRILVNERGRSVRLVVLGQGPLRNELLQFIRLHKLDSHVTLAGFVPNPQPWYRHARLFVLPSLCEGLPNALLEAVACGTPVLATDSPGGTSEILDGGRCGRLVPPGDGTVLANAIADCMDHPPEWQSLTRAALHHVRDLCDLISGLRRLEDLFDSVVANDDQRIVRS
ncbi:MAG: glycosyltransferase [Planctomycetota bacterium]